MIRFNRRPGFFLTNPDKGKRHLKAIIDITYDQTEHSRNVKPLMRAFEHLFSCGPIGPDDKPMKLGTFTLVQGPLFKANVPNANGDIYPEDVMAKGYGALPPQRFKAVSMGATVKKDVCSVCHPPLWKRLKPYLIGVTALLVVEFVVGLLVWCF